MKRNPAPQAPVPARRFDSLSDAVDAFAGAIFSLPHPTLPGRWLHRLIVDVVPKPGGLVIVAHASLAECQRLEAAATAAHPSALAVVTNLVPHYVRDQPVTLDEYDALDLELFATPACESPQRVTVLFRHQ